MGFGIAIFGYACLLLQEFGGAAIGALLLAYGFYLASRVNVKFMYAAVTALFLFPRGIFLLLDTVRVINLDKLTEINTALFILNTLALITMSVFWMSAVADIAKENGSEKLRRRAERQRVITVLFFAAAAVLQFVLPGEGDVASRIIGARYVLQYAVLLYNIAFLHTCFVLITTEKNHRAEMQELAKERAEKMREQYEDSKEGSGNGKKRRGR
ncbi:MAG: hypothetical protein J5793_01830 [Clostridia bacterium]|nr:hypothetical protein [Clostridia bacterium]